jgi:putative ABC transport system substrate-binding protein
MARDRVHGVLVIGNPLSVAGRAEIATSAERHRLPVMYEAPAVFAAQGLISLGAIASDVQSRAATFVDRLLKGARAADLPVEQPTKFQLVVNLKAAKAIGLTIPASLLSRADQIIE